ncbi:hypothetical protein [Rhizobium laguerreae]|uniref:hypothetical protein n=1 Tax=Rhizobium laguerreae TaxID=1076926 RepID=UPI001C90FDAF|nr:hypothetical protein [Rhizobium laguerreae]MBY3347997.1 hypothetical protein [Rhizobium laguerreae]MBY3354960.1 hypothetical protein [Rhizobium laguerreae]MBY3376265.1 hypothetical protein [Rhizobium laguerreae]MBY3431264.1 hypothetical protein [Rhizobium laguerreae]MBY3439879.1 hypothetical protein [Rhizobium laguerreae]
MAGIDSLIKYAVGILGIPALTTAVGVAFTAKNAVTASANAAMSASSTVQTMPEDQSLTKALNIKDIHRGGYGKDYSYFTISSYDGALKRLDSSGSGDLYLISYEKHKYFVFAKYGIDTVESNVKVISHLAKRGAEIEKHALTNFLRPIAEAIIEQQARIEQMKRNGAQPL